MKFIIIAVVVLFAGVHSTPHQRWVAVEDDAGRKHLVDTNPIQEVVEPAFNPATDINYFLFTRANPTAPQRIFPSDLDSVRNSNWDASRHTIFHAHGWNGGGQNSHTSVRNGWLQAGDYNVVIVDWGAGAQTINYITARNRVGETGQEVAAFINDLVRNGLASYANTIVAGHSLGAHVAGNIGKGTNGQLSAIFGTDAAGPLFNAGSSDRLDFNDAVYTESIITNAGVLGYAEPIAHATFYPHFGNNQPGCGNADPDCNHARANQLYAESLNSVALVGRQCANYNEVSSQNCPGTGDFAVLGGTNSKSLRGVFVLETNAQSPFGRG